MELEEAKAIVKIYSMGVTSSSEETRVVIQAAKIVGAAEELGHTIQQCYLECLAVECGEGECARAIATKFPEYVSRIKT